MRRAQTLILCVLLGAACSSTAITVDPAPPAPATVGATSSEVAPAPMTSLRLAEWSADLAALDQSVRSNHVNPFHTISEGDWADEVALLDGRIDELSDLGVALELQRLVGLLGDGHTRLGFDPTRVRPDTSIGLRLPIDRYPVLLGAFADGIGIVRSFGGPVDLSGRLVSEIHGVPVADLVDSAIGYTSGDNRWGRAQQALALLVAPEFLDHILGADAATAGTITLLGGESVTLEPIKGGAWAAFSVPPDPEFDQQVPLWQSRPGSNYWAEQLDQAIYVQVSRTADDPNSGQPFKDFVDEVFAAIDSGEASRLVIDFRLYPGGDSEFLIPLILRLAEHPIAAPQGNVFVLVGPITASSAVLNSIDLLNTINPIFVGEPTATSPNHYGESRSVGLVNSGLVLNYPTVFFAPVADGRDALYPAVEIRPTVAEFVAGDDPVLDAALSWPN